MTKIIFHGIGSNSFESLNTTSFSIQDEGGNWILTDCGPDTPRQIKKAGIGFLSISHVVLTHRHLDHCLGLPYLLFGRNLEAIAAINSGKNEPIPQLNIVSEGELWNRLRDLLRFAHPELTKTIESLKFTEISGLVDNELDLGPGSLKLSAYVMNHAVPCFGYCIRRNGENLIAYSSDTLPTDTFVNAVKNVRLLIHEAMVPSSDIDFSIKTRHSTTIDAGATILKINPSMALVVHLRPAYLGRITELEKEVSDAASLLVKFPIEGSEMDLDP